jgi:UDPglucose--hexose-1-phosphate uridylyltransferase
MSTCYFCAGNEMHTPVETAAVLDDKGRWRVRVVPNKYPAVTPDQDERKAFGVHEVIIESSEHLLSVTQLSVDELTRVLGVYRDRLRYWSTEPLLKHISLFKNSGFAAGASLEHIHSQLVALPYVPPSVQAELDGAASYADVHGRCVFCDFCQDEVQNAVRVVIQQGGYVAICAVAPRQPYETWLIPERHAARFEATGDGQIAALAKVLHQLLSRLEAASPGVSYNLLLHTAPYSAAEEDYHWHWELVPRLTHEAGLEWGGGVYITPLSPERAAKHLREAI